MHSLSKWRANIRFCTGYLLKVNSINSAGRHKTHRYHLIFHPGAKLKFPEYLPRSFPLPTIFKKYRDSINLAVTWLKSRTYHLISPSNFDGQLKNILVTCLCLCARVLRFVLWSNSKVRSMWKFYFLVWCYFKFFGTRGVILNIWVKRGMNSIWKC